MFIKIAMTFCAEVSSTKDEEIKGTALIKTKLVEYGWKGQLNHNYFTKEVDFTELEPGMDKSDYIELLAMEIEKNMKLPVTKEEARLAAWGLSFSLRIALEGKLVRRYAMVFRPQGDSIFAVPISDYKPDENDPLALQCYDHANLVQGVADFFDGKCLHPIA